MKRATFLPHPVYHTWHGSVCCKDDLQSLWEKGKLWPSANPKSLNRSSPNLNGVITSWTLTNEKIGLNSPRCFRFPYRWNIHPSCSKFTTLFWFFNSPIGEFVRPILTLNTSNDAVLRKEVVLYCYKIKIGFLTFSFEKFEKKITMAPMW